MLPEAKFARVDTHPGHEEIDATQEVTGDPASYYTLQTMFHTVKGLVTINKKHRQRVGFEPKNFVVLEQCRTN